MFVARSIAADHKDLIHDVSFDFHGRRMATCSSDQSVKVWDKSESGDWHCTASWKTHSGSVWRVTWAHPEFGQVLASCSFDRTAAVWEEIVGESNDKLRGQSHWVKRTTLVDSRTSVTDVKFAPKHMGLMLATCSADGIVRIYEAPDVMNLSQWSLQHEISCKLSCSCISWNPSSSRAHSPMIAVGSDDSSPNAMAKVQVFEYNENTRKYAKAETLMTVTDPVHDIAFAPNLGRSFHILAIATKDVRIFTLKPVRKELTSSGGPTKFEIHLVAQFDNHNSQVWRVSWNITGTVLASSGDDGCVRLWKANYMDNWKCTGILKGNGSPVNGNSQQGNSNPSLGSNTPNLQNSLNGSSAGRLLVRHEAPFDAVAWRTAVFMIALHFAVTILRLFNWCLYRSKISFFSELQFCGQSLREMADFRGIAEESFPSFLTNSLLGNSGTLENVTLSSNLGLPVAVSTLARNRSITDNRYSDVLASYLVDGRFSVPTESSPSSQIEREPKEKLQLSFQDDEKKDFTGSQHLSDAPLSESDFQGDVVRTEEVQVKTAKCFHNQDLLDKMSPQEQMQDSPVDFCLSSWINNKENKVVVPEAGQHVEDKNPNSDLSHTSLLENEKLMSLTSLEDSSEDDIDDEEFYDDHLEAYFEQLAIPGMIYEDLEGQESPEDDFKLPTSDRSQVNEHSGKSQSENNNSLISHGSCSSGNSEMANKESNEGCLVCLPETSNSVGTGESKKHVDGVSPFSSSSWRIEKKESAENLSIVSNHGRTIRVTDTKCDPAYFHDTNASKGDFDLMDPLKLVAGSPHQNKHLTLDSETALPVDSCIDIETSKVSIKKNVDLASLKPVSHGGMNSMDSLRSPTSERRTCESYESIEKSKDQVDLPQNVVYQNEEGRWVTDLAYYTSFNNEQVLNMSLTNEMNEDFCSGSEALALIAQDEEEFNKEHQFMQEENIDAQNTSVALGDTSWGTSVNYNVLRKSLSTSDLDKDDASYLRLSLGEFFAQRSEALGCLGGSYSVKRPSFGYSIKSPEKREPIALIRKSDLSKSNLDKEMAHLNHDQFSGNVNEQSEAQLSEISVTLQAEELESISQMNENDVTLTNDKGTTEDIFFVNSKGKLANDSDSVLRISTIASAIANASVSTDPLQLAAMIKTLSNKTREKTFQEPDKQKDCSSISHVSPNDLEKNNGSNVFDVEKYLKKTEVSRYEGGVENFSRAGTSDLWDLSLPNEHTTQYIHTVDLGATNITGRQPQENLAAVFYGGSGERANHKSLRTVNFSNSILANMRESESTVVDVKTYSVDNKLPDIGDSEKDTSVSTPTSNSYPLVRNPRIASLWLLEECEEIQNNREIQRENESVCKTSNSEKHVTFEKHSIISPKIVDLKNPSPENAGHGSEDDQDSFRPSTSPLSHSSPSEISGTGLSGCALESFDSAFHHQKPPCESALCQSACPQDTMSRLTYVSEHDSICPTTGSDHDLEDRKGDITNELSTTIIQASPIPSGERTVEKLKEKLPSQSKGKGALSYIIQNNSDIEKVTETTSLSSKSKDVKSNLSWSKDLSSKSGDPSKTSTVGLTSDPSELDQVSLALLCKSDLSHPAVSATAHLSTSCEVSVNKGQRITSEDTSTADSALSGQLPHPMASGGLCAPVSSTADHGCAPKRHNVPIAVPTFLTQHSITTAPYAHQCLGTLPSAGKSALPQCHAGSTTVCGFSGGCPYSAIAGEHVQKSVAMGTYLGQNINSGLMGTSSFYNSYSNALDQNLLSTAKSFPMQSVGANCGIEPWDSGMMSGLGKARVPEELKFPHACCVGIASQTHLSVLNPTDRWLQVSLGVLSVSINGEKVDLSAYPCLVFKNKIIIRPHATEEIKVLFIPSDPGIFRCTFSVASWPFSADTDTILQAEALASTVILTAIAETPMIEVETETKDVLDFGDLIYGGWKALPLKLINKTHATVPIRLIINAVSTKNAIAWRCFTFSKEPVLASMKAAAYADVIAQLAAPSVINQMMPASYDGQDPEFLIIWVLFHSPKKRITSSDSAEEFLARVDIEVDSPNPTPVIKSIHLRARAGIARIHAPKDLQTMHLFASVASSTKQHLPLKNAGNIDVYLDIKIPDQGGSFSVDPEKLFLKPGEEHEIMVLFTPEDPKTCEERILRIFVQPFGPQYEVMLKGEVVSSENKPLTPGCCSSDVPSILSNKQFLTWGGIPLGRTQLQKLTLRNNSPSITQHLRLLIRGQDQDCFQLHHTFGSEERLTSNYEIRIHPKEDINISILFAPTRLSCMLAKLEIKQLGIRSQPGVKFAIPLSGYGGTSNLILEDVKKLPDSYMVTVKDLIPGKESRTVFSVRNTGSRAAFVKVVCFKDSQRKVLLDSKILKIFPDKFVLKEGTQEDVTIIYNPSHRESSFKTTTELSTIYFFGGDEISRQQFQRALLHKPGIMERILPEHSVLRKIDFAEPFQDELLVTEVYDLPQRPNDIQLFYGNMRKIILSVIGEFRESISSREFLQPSSKAGLELKSESDSPGKHGGNVSLDVLPVKGPQGSPLLQVVNPSPDKSASEETWTIQPEHLILMAPSAYDLAKTGCFRILNNSIRLLKFELYWPAHCLTVTPQHGFIAPKSVLQILVSPNSSLSTKRSMFPWSGLIYIHCDNGQEKIVKVQIREDLTQQELLTSLASSPFGILSPDTGPAVSYLAKPITKPPSTKVEIRNKTVTFSITEPGESSESYLELENHGNRDVKWHLSSLAPPYVKGIDESGDVFRATYAAFICFPISGILESHGTQKVSITFLPRDRGDYAQFWDVECHHLKEPHLKHTLRFQLSGQSVRSKNEPENSSIFTNTLIKINNIVKPQNRAISEASALMPGRQLDLTHRGVYAPEDMYQFLPTRVGESRTLKVNLRNNSFITHSLKFLSPREPFYVKHSKYSLRAQHYINMPVQFRPKSAGKFEALLVIQTDEGKSVAIQLRGEALEKN
ncbi:centrosomal protein of 192 kDa isoform X3 [Talpa occidentalis]|uniref:centrosomal protein of 192 kDa isoform X3 n=1 Tax=Talpa occidentalis TaxID=50954 RepID=UPI00188DF073|nr:centrosomal protein of 192 kDa isoform X3 [Talpa occidentalis]